MIVFNPQPKAKPVKLKSAAWKKRRVEILERDKYTCQICECWFGYEPDQLHPHHVKYKSQGGGDEETNVISLCYGCHRNLHDGRLSESEKVRYWQNVQRIK